MKRLLVCIIFQLTILERWFKSLFKPAHLQGHEGPLKPAHLQGHEGPLKNNAPQIWVIPTPL